MTAFSLLRTRRFLPYFITQATAAFNDNLIRRAFEMLITFQAMSGALAPQTAIFLLLGLFMLPFFGCSALAGYLADTQRKDRLAQYIKLAECFLIILAAVALFYHNFWLACLTIFGLGIHSSFFGPVKYSLPPQHVAHHELIAANGLVEAGTNISILLGTLTGSILIVLPHGEIFVSIIAAMMTTIGLIASYLIPAAPPQTTIPIIKQHTGALLRSLFRQEQLWRISLGISWFWALGAVLISLFSLIVKELLHAPEFFVSIFFVIFSIGVGFGSLLCNKILKGSIEATFVPLSALGMSVGLLGFHYLLSAVAGQNIDPLFLCTSVKGFFMSLSLFLLASCAGLFIVPLYGLLQSLTTAANRSQIIAANNILNACLLVFASVSMSVFFALGGTIQAALFLLAIINLIAALYTCLLIPEHLLKGSLQAIFRIFFRARVEGLHHLSETPGRALLIANHLSFLDAVMLAAYLPSRITFAIHTSIARKWWMKPSMQLFDMIPIDPMNPMAIRVLVERLKEDKKVMIFPEGRLTVTGALMKIYDGPGLIADKANAPIIPIRLDGFQYTLFSRVSQLFGWKLFPQLSLIVCPPKKLTVDETIRGRKRRDFLALALHDVMTDLIYQTHQRGPTILHGIRRVGYTYSFSKILAKDLRFGTISVGSLLQRSFVLSRILGRTTPPDPCLGLLLPSSIPLLLFFLSVQWHRRLPALLNYSHSPIQMQTTCALAAIKTVISSRQFIALAKLDQHIALLQARGITIIYTEDIQQQTSKLSALQYALWYTIKHAMSKLTGIDLLEGKGSDPAVVLFTSGSEGTPKGVVLSHDNLLHNVDQVTSIVPIQPTDKVCNALPMFHSFGLTGGTLMPILKGAQTLLYPSPVHYRIIPEIVYDESSTILFGTPTFLAGYAKKAHPYDFNSLRYVFSGAERLNESVRAVYQEKFGLRVFEGYGATETAPVIAVNTPFQARAGTVGRLVPGISYLLEPVAGIEDGGRLIVKGANVMLGYYKIDQPGVLQPPHDGWYDTGDIVSVDEKGFITIKGRAKRFAKIGGEMISLTAIEQQLEAAWPQAQFAVIAISDEKKGEKLILMTTLKEATRSLIATALKERGCSELGFPREIHIEQSLPFLGSGKIDIQAVTEQVQKLYR